MLWNVNYRNFIPLLPSRLFSILKYSFSSIEGVAESQPLIILRLIVFINPWFRGSIPRTAILLPDKTGWRENERGNLIKYSFRHME